MNIIYKYTIPISLTDAAATNDANAATGYANNGPYADAIVAMAATGALTDIVVGNAVGVPPTIKASFDGRTETAAVYDIPLKDVILVANQPHTYAIPLSLLGIDSNQMINSMEFLNRYGVNDNCLYPISDRFVYKYDFDNAKITFSFPHDDAAFYTNLMGLKLRLNLIAKTL